MINNFPDGQLNKEDEGELKIAMFVKDSRLIIDFGKQTSWIGFDAKSLQDFIDVLEKKHFEIA